jgi:hypothetical protein
VYFQDVHPLDLHRRINPTARFSRTETLPGTRSVRWICYCTHIRSRRMRHIDHELLHPRETGRKEQAMDFNFWLGILIGLVAGGGAIWYLKVRSLQIAVVTMTGEYRIAEKGRKELEARIRQYPVPVAT